MSPTAPSTTPVAAIAQECTRDLKTLEVAVETYHTYYGAYPNSMADVIGEFSLDEITTYDLGPDGAVVRAPGVPCTDDDEPSAPELMTAEQIEELLDPDELGGPECAREAAAILAAAMEFEAERGHEPDTLADLDRYLTVPVTLWVFDDVLDEMVTAPGSGCMIPSYADETCDTELRTLRVATEAYQALYGEPAQDQQALVDTDGACADPAVSTE